ncbi:esterase FE4-like [Leguminivora glycinivorella]|uniref:esterase FE4-like n=1 Tax=Leguminivora glycinivorella TaxID=1035111 RepID=UPI00200D599F|nr:esterase FE4-like [Leguminivora glycinivorella]
MYRFHNCLVFFCLYSQYLGGIVNAENKPLVTVAQGQLQGVADTLYDGSTYYSFKGVPYAQAPVGELRFRAPQPPQSWKGIRQATEYGSICAQTDINTGTPFRGSEDCLFLNVFTKSLDGSKPVMVWIHGGGYLSGSGNDNLYGPKFIVQEDVVLVTLNYRLEVIGFLSLETAEVPGNAGMKDQVAALKWVKENIAKFGGDPDNITIFGESSGACSVTHHILSPMTKGLFHKVIAQSGSSVHDWAIGEDSKNRAFRVGKVLGKDTQDTTELLKFLRSVSVKQLTNLTLSTYSSDAEKYRGSAEKFLPVVEKVFDNVEAYLTNNVLTTLQSNSVRKVPLLLGFNSAEGMVSLADRLSKLDIYNKNPSYDVPREIVEKVTEGKLSDLGKSIKTHYIGDKDFTKKDYQAIVSLLSDSQYIYDVHRFAHLYSKHSSPIYMYEFSLVSDLNFLTSLSNAGLDVKGVCHGDEVFYIFSSSFTKAAYEAQEKLKGYVSMVTKLWTNFAKSSNPTPAGSATTWPVYTSANKKYLDINEKLTVGTFANKAGVDFWDTLYCEAGVPCISK